MFKKAIIATAVLAASTGLAFANGGTYQPAPSHTHSAYVGVSVSRDFFHGDTSIALTDGKTDVGNDGWDGNLNAGLGWTFNNHYYLGGEIFGGLSSAKIEIAGQDVKYKYNYGIALIPGVKITDSTMLYGRVGYIRGHFEGSHRSSTNRNGLQLGLGVQAMVTNNVSARMEYDYNRFSKKGGVRPIVDTVSLGVAYHFMSA